MLEDLYAGSIADAASRSKEVAASELEQQIGNVTPALDSYSLFKSGTRIQVIAEIKRASPSKGHLAAIENPANLANLYEQAGAAAISVLTEERKFLGSLNDLKQVRSEVKVPILRKDFIANEYQILEARASGADLVLLICAGLNDPQLAHLYNFVEELGMQSLVETHSSDEVKRAAQVGAKIIGINARDLSTFDTDLNLFGKLVELIPDQTVAVAESAVRGIADVENYAKQGAEIVLVGEALVTGDAKALIRSFNTIPKIRI